MTSLRRLVPVLLVALAVAGLTLPATGVGATTAAKAKAKRCLPKAPTALAFERVSGKSSGRLIWHKPRKAKKGVRYRVYRNDKVIGQTTRRRMTIRVKIGRRYRFAVATIGSGCKAQKRITIRYRVPGTPSGVAVGDTTGATARLSWVKAKRGDGKLAGYRVLRDGKVLGQSTATQRDVPLGSNKSYRFTVTAVDSRGRASAASKPVTVVTGHAAPAAPQGLTAIAVSDSQIGLSWQPSSLARGKVSGYRVLRDGVVVGQVKGTTAVISNLAAGRTYGFSVIAIDELGYLSPPSAVVSARTEDPVPSTGHVHGFLLATTDQSFIDFRTNYRSFGYLYPTYFDCSASGAFEGRDDPLVTQWAQARKVRVLARVNCQRTATVHAILTDATLREQWLSTMVAQVETYGYDGIQLDFEAGPASDRAAMSSFVADLSDRLHARGKQLSQAVSAKTADSLTHPRSGIFDYPVLNQYVDHIFVMAWGLHWSTSGPGAADPLPWVTNVANYVASMPNPRKFVLGMPLYATDWPNGGGPSNPGSGTEYQPALAQMAAVGATPVLDATVDGWHYTYTDARGSHDVWFGDAATIGRRVRLASERGFGGVGVWRLGLEDQRIWQDPMLAPGSVWP